MSSLDSINSNTRENGCKRRRMDDDRHENNLFSSIIFTNLPNMHSDEIYDELYNNYNYLKYYNVQMTTHNSQTVAYVNFDDNSTASRAYRETVDKTRLFDGQVLVAPVIRGQRMQPVRVRGKSKRRKERKVEENEPCRSLFVGNITQHVTSDEVERVFSEYGYVDSVIMRCNNEGGYCFVTFGDIEMAINAKENAKNVKLDGNTCVVGFGKAIPNSCLYIGRVSEDMKNKVINQFDRFGRIIRDYWPENADCCYIEFDELSSAIMAYKRVHHYLDNIIVDYARQRHMTFEFTRKCAPFRRNRSKKTISNSKTEKFGKNITSSKSEKRSSSHGKSDMHGLSSSPSKHVHTDSKSDRRSFTRSESKSDKLSVSPSDRKLLSPMNDMDEEASRNSYSLSPISDVDSLSLSQLREAKPIWTVTLSIKSERMPVSMSLVKGKSEFISNLSKFNQLAINHRLKLEDDKLNEVRRRMREGEYAVLVGFGPIGRLLEYLDDKKAAGVMCCGGGVLHVFGKCDFVRELLSPQISGYDSLEEFVTVLVICS